MLDHNENPIAQLEPGARFFISAMREWVKGASRGHCVCATIDGAFAAYRVPDAADSFHRAMRTIHHNALMPIYFGSPDRETPTEHEAMLLSALGHALAGGEPVKQAARAMVHADMVPVLVRDLHHIATTLQGAGHGVAPTATLSANAGLRDRIIQTMEALPPTLRRSFYNRDIDSGVNDDE